MAVVFCLATDFPHGWLSEKMPYAPHSAAGDTPAEGLRQFGGPNSRPENNARRISLTKTGRSSEQKTI